MNVTTMKNKSKVQAILQKYSSVYSHGIGKGEGIKANLHLNEDVKPIFCKAQPVSYTMKPKIEQELENLKFKTWEFWKRYSQVNGQLRL